MAYTLAGRWVLPGDRPPLERGTVTIENNTIISVDAAGSRHADEHLGDVAILPGFVNAHTHLDLTGMRGLCPPTPDFCTWLRGVVRHRRARTAEQAQDDIRAGLAECQRYGTTLVGDISGQGLSRAILNPHAQFRCSRIRKNAGEASDTRILANAATGIAHADLADAAIHSVVFLELLGLTVERAAQAHEQAVSWLASRTDASPCRIGLSPHAPYSVRSDLFKRIADQLTGTALPCAIHLAESVEEVELLEHQRGPMAEFLKELGVWDPAGLSASPAQVARWFAKVPHTLLIHANYMTAAEVGTAAVVYCPRTHAAFGHPPHPFRDFLAQGICVALGTDGLASNPDLDVLAEARFVQRRFPDVPGEMLLRMITLNGAKALGMDDVTGSLTAGKSADLVVVPLERGDASDPYRVFAADTAVSGVMCRGAWLRREK